MNRGRGHPLTAELVTQSMLGVFIRLVMIMANVGTGNELARMGVVTQSVTVLEQFLRLILELDMDRGRGAGRIVIRSVRGLSRAVALAESRVKASASTFQSNRSIREMAEQRDISVLRELLRTHGRRLRWLFRVRHALTHTVGIVRFNEARAYAIVRDVIHAVLAGRPRYMTALLLVEGRAMSLAGRYADARRAYEGVLGVCGGLNVAGRLGAWVHTCAGHALARLGREDEAEACYKKAQEVDPGYALAHLEMGHLMVRAGRPEEALFMYKGSIGADPDYAPARIARGHALGVVRREGEDVLAIECHEDALRLDSEEMSAYAGCGISLAMMGHYESAARWYRRAIEKDPDDAAGRTGLANSLAALGRSEEAINEYRAAVGIAYRTGFGGVSGTESEGDGAMTGRIARELGRVAAYRGLAGALYKSGHVEESLPAYRRAAELDAGNAEAHRGLAEALFGAGRIEESLPAYRRAAELDAGNAEAHRGLAGALYESGRIEESLPAYRRAAELDAGNVNVWVALAKALAETGRSKEADGARDKALGYR